MPASHLTLYIRRRLTSPARIWAFDVSKTLRAGTALECFDVTPAKFPRPFADPSLRLRPDRARRATSLTPLTVRWIDRLHDTFAAHRLAVAAADRPAPKPWQQSMFTQQFLILANEMAGAVYDRDPASGRGAELRRLAQEADEEMRGGSCKRQDARVVVGRKAA